MSSWRSTANHHRSSIQIIKGPLIYRLLLYQVYLWRTRRMNSLLFLFSCWAGFGTKNWSVLIAVNIAGMERECYSILNCCYGKLMRCVSNLVSSGKAVSCPENCCWLGRFACWSHLWFDCLLFCSLPFEFSFEKVLADAD
jgi:hypothetical protein